VNLETNYKAWHPESHVLFRLLKGNQHEKGSIVYAEEILGGKVRKIKMLCTNVEKFRKVEYKTFFPLSIFHPKSAYVFEPKGQRCVFTAINRFKIPKLFKKKVESLVKETETHIKEEGINLKKILES